MNWLRLQLDDDRKSNRLVSLLSILLGFLVGILIIIITGLNPVDMINAIIQAVLGISANGFNLRYIGEFIVSSMPIILTGLSVAFAFRAGLFNIGAEGQMICGGFAAVSVAFLVDLPPVVHVIACVLAAAAAGALWGFIPGLLKAKFNINEVVVTIMLNYTAMYVTNYLIKMIPGSSLTRTLDIPESASLSSSLLSSLTNNSRLNWGIIIVILSIVIFKFIIDKTTFGYEIRAVGANSDAAKYAGMKVSRNIIYSMMIAGVFAGLAGAVVVLGTMNFGRVLTSFDGYGTDGIAVALVGGNTAFGSLFGGLLLGGLQAAQTIMQASGIPKEIAVIVSAVIITLIAMKNGLKDILKRIAGGRKS